MLFCVYAKWSCFIHHLVEIIPKACRVDDVSVSMSAELNPTEPWCSVRDWGNHRKRACFPSRCIRKAGVISARGDLCRGGQVLWGDGGWSLIQTGGAHRVPDELCLSRGWSLLCERVHEEGRRYGRALQVESRDLMMAAPDVPTPGPPSTKKLMAALAPWCFPSVGEEICVWLSPSTWLCYHLQVISFTCT